MPLRTERATSLAASSYTCLVSLSILNTRSTEKKKKKKIKVDEERESTSAFNPCLFNGIKAMSMVLIELFK